MITTATEHSVVIAPQDVRVNTDKKTGTQNVAYQFVHPDGTEGCVVILYLNKQNREWEPEIETILINFK